MPIVYALTCKDPTKIYFGSSMNTKEERYSKHKANHKLWKDGKSYYCASVELFEIGNVEIHIVMDCPGVSELQLREIEQIFLDNCECVNIMNAFITEDQRKEYNKKYKQTEKYKQKSNEYQQGEKFKEYQYNYYRTEKYRENERIRNQKRKEAKIKNIV
jgi:hypothetical protein